MQIPWNRINQNKPAIFDWLVFTISLLLSLLYPRLSDLTESAEFSGWILVALVLYTTGLWLKHRPVYYRLVRKGWEPKNFFLLLFLVIGHWIIMLASVIMAEDAFLSITGQLPRGKNQPASGLETIVNIGVSVFITFLAFRPGGKQKKTFSEKYLFRRELLGDIILICGVSLLSFVFWDASIVRWMGQMEMEKFGKMFGLFIFLGFAYMMVYLPLRYLYFIEDNSRQAWRRLLIIFLLILVRGLFEAMRG